MNSFEINLSINPKSQKQLEAVRTLIGALIEELSGSDTAAPASSAPDSKTKVVKKAAVQAPLEPLPASTEPKTAPVTPAPAAEVPTSPGPTTEGIKIEEVRTLLASKVEKHRSAIKEKLTAMGAPNVSSMDASKYGEFIDFLNSLA